MPSHRRLPSGWLSKRGRFVNDWKRRWFVLHSDNILRYYIRAPEPLEATADRRTSTPAGRTSREFLATPSGDAVGWLDLRCVSVVSVARDPYLPEGTLELQTPTRIVYLLPESYRERTRWLEALRAARMGAWFLKGSESFCNDTDQVCESDVAWQDFVGDLDELVYGPEDGPKRSRSVSDDRLDRGFKDPGFHGGCRGSRIQDRECTADFGGKEKMCLPRRNAKLGHRSGTSSDHLFDLRERFRTMKAMMGDRPGGGQRRSSSARNSVTGGEFQAARAPDAQEEIEKLPAATRNSLSDLSPADDSDQSDRSEWSMESLSNSSLSSNEENWDNRNLSITAPPGHTPPPTPVHRQSESQLQLGEMLGRLVREGFGDREAVELQEVFFLSYRAFLTPAQMLDMLLCCYVQPSTEGAGAILSTPHPNVEDMIATKGFWIGSKSSDSEYVKKLKQRCRQGTVELLVHWTSEFFEDFSSSMRRRIRRLAALADDPDVTGGPCLSPLKPVVVALNVRQFEETNPVTMPREGTRLKRNRSATITDRVVYNSEHRPPEVPPETPSIQRPGTPPSDFLEVDARAIAEQLTLLVFADFKRARLTEFTDRTWQKRATPIVQPPCVKKNGKDEAGVPNAARQRLPRKSRDSHFGTVHPGRMVNPDLLRHLYLEPDSGGSTESDVHPRLKFYTVPTIRPKKHRRSSLPGGERCFHSAAPLSEPSTTTSPTSSSKLDLSSAVSLLKNLDRISLWAATEILQQNEPSERCRMMRHILEIADECLWLQNLHLCLSLVAGIQLVSVERLRHLSRVCSEPVFARRREKIASLLSPHNSFTTYHGTLELCLASGKPCLPFLGLTFLDLLQMQSNSADPVKVEFTRLKHAAKLIYQMQSCQLNGFSGKELAVDPSIRALLRTRLNDTKCERELYERSCALEPLPHPHASPQPCAFGVAGKSHLFVKTLPSPDRLAGKQPIITLSDFQDRLPSPREMTEFKLQTDIVDTLPSPRVQSDTDWSVSEFVDKESSNAGDEDLSDTGNIKICRDNLDGRSVNISSRKDSPRIGKRLAPAKHSAEVGKQPSPTGKPCSPPRNILSQIDERKQVDNPLISGGKQSFSGDKPARRSIQLLRSQSLVGTRQSPTSSPVRSSSSDSFSKMPGKRFFSFSGKTSSPTNKPSSPTGKLYSPVGKLSDAIDVKEPRSPSPSLSPYSRRQFRSG
eukprot:263786_1